MRLIDVKVGEIIYSCERFGDTGKFGILAKEVGKINQTYTPKGKPRDPTYMVKPLNYSFAKSWQEPYEIGNLYREYRMATEAVADTLRHLFDKHWKDENISHEQKLLRAIFDENGVPSNIDLTIDLLPRVIADLMSLQEMMVKAAKLDMDKLKAKEGGHQ